MEIQKSKIVEALSAASIGLATKEMIEQSTSIIFSTGGIYTYNDEIAVFYKLDGVDFEGAVGSKELTAFCNKGKGDTISLTPGEEQTLLLTCGKSKAGLSLIPDIRLPKLTYPKKFKALPEDFIPAMKYVVGCAGSDFTSPILTNICIKADETVASDRYRLGIWRWKEGFDTEKDILLPAHQLSKLLRLDLEKYAVNDGWMHFKTKQGGVVSCRTFEEDFIKYSHIISYTKDVKIDFPADLTDVLERAEIFSKSVTSTESQITVTFSKKKINVSSKSDAGWFKENVRSTYTGEDMTFNISPVSLHNILKKTSAAYVDGGKIVFDQESIFYMAVLQLKK